jgi:hypothetical protein
MRHQADDGRCVCQQLELPAGVFEQIIHEPGTSDAADFVVESVVSPRETFFIA